VTDGKDLTTAPAQRFYDGRFLDGRSSTSSIAVRDGDKGDIHAPLNLNVKVVLGKSSNDWPIMDIFVIFKVSLR
jgi:hypothetical protein